MELSANSLVRGGERDKGKMGGGPAMAMPCGGGEGGPSTTHSRAAGSAWRQDTGTTEAVVGRAHVV
jgi:hypothetical protein